MTKLPPFARSLLELTPATICAFIGGYVFSLINLPAPWISGAMLGAMLSALIRPLPEMPVQMRDAALLLAGTTMGAGVTPETVTLMAKAPLSFAILALCVIIILYLSSWWLARFHGWRREDALLAAAPGALSTVLALGIARGGDIIGIAVVQTMRLFILIALLPTAIGWLEGSSAIPISSMATMSWDLLVLMLIGGAVSAYLLSYLKLTAAAMIGGALFGATLHGAGLVSGYPPAPVAVTGFVMIGVMIATRTRGISWRAVGKYAGASIASLAIGAIVAAIFALLAAWLINVRIGAALLAFAPGGVEAMTILSMSLAYDPLYVAAHHIARFMGIGLCIPLWFRFVDRNQSAK